ncbi:MAG TPA: VOC family protein [Methylomirabilota bacterium]|jgi:catechol 2,3-dioxygenase-like lactoylglutathione lyase family enzyme|nr:VOC family protein [Methylomirabilota bacterium]
MTTGLRTRFDHIAIGMHRIADATDVLVGRLGGRPDSGGPGGGFRWAAWRFAGGGCVEVIEPAGADGFLHRFLAARGPGLHHVTFKVSSLAEAGARAEAQGYRLVGRDESDADWRVAYLHPKEALGIVVQLGQSAGRYGRRPWEVPEGPASPPPPARVLGLRTQARSATRARLLWEYALGGALAHELPAELVFRWPGSSMRIVSEIAPDSEEGPIAIDLAPGGDPGLAAGPVAPLGAAFRVDTHTAEL